MWTLSMKSSLRYLLKQKGYTFILVFGLAIGLAASFLILLWVMDESNYDRFHEHAKELHIVLADEQHADQMQTYTGTPGPLAEVLKTEFPEIVNSTRIVETDKFLGIYEDKYFIEKNILGVDPAFLEMFSFPLIRGDKKQVLNDPNSVIITESIAKKYFGNADPIGKPLHFDPMFDFTVTGVLKDLPKNSLFNFEILVPVTTFMIRYTNIVDRWDGGCSATYVQLMEGQTAGTVSPKIASVVKEHSAESNVTIRLFPVTQIHTHPEDVPLEGVGVAMSEIYTYLGVALLILLIACINFMNLSTARFGQRLKEIGVKKVIGASRLHLVRQFMSEALLLTSLALALALVLTELLIPLLNLLAGKEFELFSVQKTGLVFLFTGIALITGLISGGYPAAFLSRFRPVHIFKNQKFTGSSQSRIRRGLVVFQFTLSMLFITATVVIFQQLKFMKNYNPGYNAERVISVPLTLHWGHREDGSFYETLKNELVANSGVVGVTQSFSTPGDMITSAGEANWEGKPADQTTLFNWMTVHYDYFKVMDIPVVDGRVFSKDFAADMSNWGGGSYMVNEAAAKMMGSDSPVGKWFEHYGHKGKIIGVVKNFNFRSLKQEVAPLAIFLHPFYNNVVLIKLRPENMQATLAFVRETWDKHAKNYPFSYTFVDDELDQVYKSEQRSGVLLNSFALFALAIACLGLLGLASFSIQQRTKEIAVRKILGSSLRNIWSLLTKEYTKWILISMALAWPLSWYALTRWLNSYAYHIEMSCWMFILPGVVTLLIAGVVVSSHVIKAAKTNPVEALRYE